MMAFFFTYYVLTIRTYKPSVPNKKYIIKVTKIIVYYIIIK